MAGCKGEVEFILQKGDLELQKKGFLSRFPRNCYSSYRLGKKISKRLIAVSQVGVAIFTHIHEESQAITDANFDVVSYQLLRASVDEMPMENDSVGLDSLLEEVWSCLEDIDVSSIGLCGIGRFMLMIDEIWERIDLVNIGIPPPDHQMSPNRSRDVCGLMEAQRRIKVACLAREEAINLFQMKVGGEILKSHQDMPKLAQVVMEECEGLPLALITIGRAMRSTVAGRILRNGTMQ
ncbi:putative disease resistance protein [Quercus suber]|uniref:Disease resistance protein n=1 Tax=Quercus suber TaxID=58331 RepID=A0AAW0K0M5_QUESU